jgi:hypothetical protein
MMSQHSAGIGGPLGDFRLLAASASVSSGARSRRPFTARCGSFHFPPVQAVMTFRVISSCGAFSFGLGDVGRDLLAAGAHS